MDRVTFLQVVNSSARLLDLHAASIESAIHQVFAYQISPSLARDLARVHTLPSAIREIKAKAEVHQGLRDSKRRIELAIHEATLAGSSGKQLTEYHLKTIVQSREATLTQHDRSSAERVLSRILDARSQISNWGTEYRRFVRSVFRLYDIRSRQLKTMNLSAPLTAEALEELDRLFIDAIERSRHIGSHASFR